MRKRIALLGIFLMIGAGAASGFTIDFDDDFFDDNESSEDDSFFDDSWDEDFEMPDFEGPESPESPDSEEDEYGICVIGVDSPCNSDEFDGDNGSESPDEPGSGDDAGDSAYFRLTDMEAPQEARAGEEILVTANLTNTGDEAAIQEVVLQLLNDEGDIAQDLDASSNQGREPGESATVGFYVTIDEPGEYTLRFSSENDSISQTITVTDNDTGDGEESVTEERTVTPAPEPDYVGDDYISYPNPRDHYKHPEVHREGSIKVCSVLLNQAGEVITGETVEDTTFRVDTNITYEDAQPVRFTTPLDQVADLVGTSDELVEGDGYLDAECAEFHDLRLNETYVYEEQVITGEHAEEIETVGYTEYWERDKPPLQNPEPYGSSEDSDGQVTLTPGDNNRHAEIIVVNKLKG